MSRASDDAESSKDIDLNSKEFKMKMEIVDEFARQGVNYWDNEIPEHKLDRIKQIHPDSWEEYVRLYRHCNISLNFFQEK
jgi:hypothetical protein